jgi:hypothetical protein
MSKKLEQVQAPRAAVDIDFEVVGCSAALLSAPKQVKHQIGAS